MDVKKELDLYLKSHLGTKEKKSFFEGIFAKRTAYKESFGSVSTYIDECANVDDYINSHKDDNLFQTLLFRYIDRTNLKDSDIYNRVNMDRRLFSKIRNENYHPSKETVILLGLALELNEDEIEDLLNSAAYSLPQNNEYDLIIRFCFINKIYDVIRVNSYLDEYGYKTLN